MWRKRNYTKRGESAIDTKRGERRFENLNFHRNLHYLNSGERAITQNVANAQLLKTWRTCNCLKRGECAITQDVASAICGTYNVVGVFFSNLTTCISGRAGGTAPRTPRSGGAQAWSGAPPIEYQPKTNIQVSTLSILIYCFMFRF